MNMSQMFRAVSEGRVVTPGGYAWSCPECGAILGQGASREARDRRALTHCLLHAAVAVRPLRDVVTALVERGRSPLVIESRL